jgi:hypothetical protein
MKLPPSISARDARRALSRPKAGQRMACLGEIRARQLSGAKHGERVLHQMAAGRADLDATSSCPIRAVIVEQSGKSLQLSKPVIGLGVLAETRTFSTPAFSMRAFSASHISRCHD